MPYQLPFSRRTSSGVPAGARRLPAEDELDAAFDGPSGAAAHEDLDTPLIGANDDFNSQRRYLGFNDRLSVSQPGRTGAIALGHGDADDVDGGADDSHPLASSSRSSTPAAAFRSDHMQQQQQHERPLPGSYDFEPQGSEGAPPPSSSMPRSNSIGSLANATSAPATRHSVANPAVSAAARFLPAGLLGRFGLGGGGGSNNAAHAGSNTDRPARTGAEGSSLLFSHDDDDDEDGAAPRTTTGDGATYPPAAGAGRTAPGGRTYGGGQRNDGVFANLTAKPDGHRRLGQTGDYVGGEDAYGDKDEVPPSYDVAAQDSAPPYWETTIIAPTGMYGPDDVLVDGMPVGNFFSFAWNLLVSMSFQFVGFLLTYLLHTTHAAKNGSRAGLGITMIQFGFFLKQRADHPEYIMDEDTLEQINSHGAHRWPWFHGAINSTSTALSSAASATATAIGSLPTQGSDSLFGSLDTSDPDAVASASASASAAASSMPSLGNLTSSDIIKMNAMANSWMAFLLMIIGWFLLLGSCLSYWRAQRYAKAVRESSDVERDAPAIVS